MENVNSIVYGEEAVEVPEVPLGKLIGVVGGFDGAEIIVNGKDTIGTEAPMGRALVVDANGYNAERV